MPYRLGVTLVLGLLLSCSSPDSESQRYHSALLAAAPGEAFSGVVLVKRGEEVLFQARYGFANKELEVPFDWETRFRYHSLTKPLMSAAVLSAVADGKISLDSLLCDSLNPCPHAWKPVTVRHLLNHTSGIGDFSQLLLDGWDGSLEATFENVEDQLSSFEPVTEPGTEWKYSNSGYVLLAHLMEQLDGRRIEEVLQSRVFGPAGMTNAGMEVSPPWDDASFDTSLVVPRMATGYNGAPGRIQEASSKMYTIPGAGGAYGNAADLDSFARALFEGTLLPRELTDVAIEVRDGASVRYALGWVVRERHGARVYRHDGGNNGYLSSLEYYPDNQLTVIILSNVGFAPIEEIREKFGEIALAGPD